MPLADPSLPSLPPRDPTPRLATPLTSLLPTASTAPIGYADLSQHVSESTSSRLGIDLREQQGLRSQDESSQPLPSTG